jgi:hypothetical protein
MKFKDVLLKKRSSIQNKWFDTIIETYPPETSQFLKNDKKQFANPVGSTIQQGVEGILENLLNDASDETVAPYLDKIIRVRAIQDFTPSQAIQFIFNLKKSIRDALGEEIRKHDLYDELLSLESRIDDLCALSFDIFMQCREKLYEIKANELHRWTYKIIENANVLKDGPDEDIQS